jgi:dTMP kinase
MSKNGKFIVFEGIDCSGKTTSINLFADNLKSRNISYIIVKFPDREGKYGQEIDKYLKNKLILSDFEAYELFRKNRKEYMNYIINCLNIGTTVICDRYMYSGIVYSYYNANKSSLSINSKLDINYINKLLKNEDYMPTPDLIMLIDGHRMRTDEIAEKYEKNEINNTIYNLFNSLFSQINIKYCIINNHESIKFTSDQLITNHNLL